MLAFVTKVLFVGLIGGLFNFNRWKTNICRFSWCYAHTLEQRETARWDNKCL